jgi:hemoglobin-like flavoprotein
MNTLTPEAIQAVRAGFARIAPIREEIGGLFYGKLFEMDPGLRPLFGDNLEAQSRMLMTAIQMVIDSLDSPENVARHLSEVGRRHGAYGAQMRDFDTFGAALIWSLQQGLGPDYTPQFETGWVGAFDLIRNVMRGGVKAQQN